MQGPVAIPTPICIYIDIQPALDLVNNPCYHQRSKHIQTRYHFVRDKVHVEKEIEVEKIPKLELTCSPSMPQLESSVTTRNSWGCSNFFVIFSHTYH